jgi:uncharacterized protein
LVIVLDTSVVVAFMNRRDDDHVRVSEWIVTAEEDLVTTPLVVAEIDRLVSHGGGSAASLAFYEDLESGAYLVEWWREAMFETVEAARRNQSLGLGLADASLMALASRLETTRIATLDERHFRIVKPLTGQAAFVLLPADT